MMPAQFWRLEERGVPINTLWKWLHICDHHKITRKVSLFAYVNPSQIGILSLYRGPMTSVTRIF